MSDVVRITDVAPRDGLQNEPGLVPLERKLELVRRLAASGVDEVEIGAFVSPRWVPQMASSDELCVALADDRPPGVVYSVLVPNERGLQTLLDLHARLPRPVVDKIAVFTAASETFARRNTNATIAETLARFGPVVRAARDAGLAVRGYVSCVVACPFEGPVAPAAVLDVCRRLLDLEVDELDLGETIGAGTRENVAQLLERITPQLPATARAGLTLHLHDTHGRAAECVEAGLERGVRSFDGAAGGLGGCPYASTPGARAPGNIATETLIETVTSAGFATRVDLERMRAAATWARSLV